MAPRDAHQGLESLPKCVEIRCVKLTEPDKQLLPPGATQVPDQLLATG